MTLNELTLSDGEVLELISKPGRVRLIFRSWDEKLWNIMFEDVVAFECFGAEGEDLDGLIIDESNDFKSRATMRLCDENLSDHRAYEFVSAWSGVVVLSVIAKSVRVGEEVDLKI